MGFCVVERSSIEINYFSKLCDDFEADFFVGDVLFVVHMLGFQVCLLEVLQQLIDCLDCIIG
jgi:hypothetical protein